LLFRARDGVTEVYGELTEVDEIDWLKISSVDVSSNYDLFISVAGILLLCNVL